ncbi:hypothetical protein EDB85DRAFT_2292852 [Lactarius pseudohatsudake]|nr:hypothetical protein EDB85DRAFT_2292852 [Lactarius pseudohatsudake]
MPAAPRPPGPSLLPHPRRHVHAEGWRTGTFPHHSASAPPLPSCPRSPVRADRGRAKAGRPTSPRRLRPHPFPLVRTAPYARKGAREAGHPPSFPIRAEGVHAGTPPPVPFPPWPRRPVRAARGHAIPGPPFPIRAEGGCARACRLPSPLPPTPPLPAPYARDGGHATRPHPSPFTRKGVHEGTRPPIPIAPGPSPLGNAARTRGHGAPERTRVHEGTTPPAAPYALARYHPGPPFPIRAEGGAPSECCPVRAEQGHAAPAPRFLLSAPPRSRGKGACEG